MAGTPTCHLTWASGISTGDTICLRTTIILMVACGGKYAHLPLNVSKRHINGWHTPSRDNHYLRGWLLPSVICSIILWLGEVVLFQNASRWLSSSCRGARSHLLDGLLIVVLSCSFLGCIYSSYFINATDPLRNFMASRIAGYNYVRHVHNGLHSMWGQYYYSYNIVSIKFTSTWRLR